MRSSQPAVLLLVCLLAGCQRPEQAMDEFQTTPLKLPNGTTIRIETMMRKEDMMRGMMFRDKLPNDRGMLFIHGSPGLYPYWMHQVKIPLDIIWMDQNKRIVEMVPYAPPCPIQGPEAQERCPTFGGHQPATYVLELAGGSIARLGLKHGDRLDF